MKSTRFIKRIYKIQLALKMNKIIRNHTEWKCKIGSPNRLVDIKLKKKLDVCSICKWLIHSKDDLIECPRCNSPFHQNHLLEWIKMKGDCPVCRERLSSSMINRQDVVIGRLSFFLEIRTFFLEIDKSCFILL